MTKKTFIALAAKFKACNYNSGNKSIWDDGFRLGHRSAVEAFMEVAAEENPNFDRARFLTACGY